MIEVVVKKKRVYTDRDRERNRSRVLSDEQRKKKRERERERAKGRVLSEAEREKKRARELRANLSHERLLKVNAYQKDYNKGDHRQRMLRLAREATIEKSVGSVCEIVIVKCRICDAVEVKPSKKANRQKGGAIYCSRHMMEWQRDGHPVKKVHHPCCDCGASVFGTLAKKRCADCLKVRAKAVKKKGGAIRNRTGSHRARARKYGCQLETVNKSVVFNRDGWKCCECGVTVVRSSTWRPDQATIDHFIPMSKGGAHSYSNVRTMCNRCNTKKGALMPSGLAAQPLSANSISINQQHGRTKES